jgi:hypothetical protein
MVNKEYEEQVEKISTSILEDILLGM